MSRQDLMQTILQVTPEEEAEAKKLLQQRERVQVKLYKARRMVEEKLSMIRTTMTHLTKWEKRVRRYEKLLDQVNAGIPIVYHKAKPKPRRRIEL